MKKKDSKNASEDLKLTEKNKMLRSQRCHQLHEVFS